MPPHSSPLAELRKAPVLVRIGQPQLQAMQAQHCPLVGVWGGVVARGMCSAPSFPRSPAPSPPELLHPPQNCSVAMCLRIQCDIASFGSQEEFGVTLTGNLSFDWYIKVCGGLRPSGAGYNAAWTRAQLCLSLPRLRTTTCRW